MKKSRISVGEVKIVTILLPEVNSQCPLCGKYPLSEEKNGKTFKKYEVAHIYPHSPTKEQLVVLKDVPKVDDVESLDNVIILCKDCHAKQDFHTTEFEYRKLYDIKQRLQKSASSKMKLGTQNVDESILEVIESLKTMDITTIRLLDLNMTPLKIDQKIGEDVLLAADIKEKVTHYFPYIQEQFQSLENYSPNNFNIIASEIRAAYLKAKSVDSSNEDIFNNLVGWLEMLKPDRNSRMACQIVLSFFVQNCEVYDEIS